jgi:hypothetical protein
MQAGFSPILDPASSQAAAISGLFMMALQNARNLKSLDTTFGCDD